MKALYTNGTVVQVRTLQEASELENTGSDQSFRIVIEQRDNQHLINFVEHMHPGKIYYDLEDLR